VRATAWVLLILLGFVFAPSISVSAQSQPRIVDVHFHPEQGWNLAALVGLMDQLGVVWAGNGPGGPDSLASDFARKYPKKFFAFCALGELIFHLQQDGTAGWSLSSQSMNSYLDRVEARLRSGQCKGIGEVYPNNLHSYGVHPELKSRYPADSPLMRRLFTMSGTYAVPLSVHLETDPTSIAELERLLDSNAKGILLWAHAGVFGDPPLLRSLLQKHSNLYCDLAARDARYRTAISNGTKLQSDWKALIEEFPDRFMVGSDVSEHSLDQYTFVITYWREIFKQLSPETAEEIAHQNAERILRLATPTP
jgi:amidohydrolase family protein